MSHVTILMYKQSIQSYILVQYGIMGYICKKFIHCQTVCKPIYTWLKGREVESVAVSQGESIQFSCYFLSVSIHNMVFIKVRQEFFSIIYRCSGIFGSQITKSVTFLCKFLSYIPVQEVKLLTNLINVASHSLNDKHTMELSFVSRGSKAWVDIDDCR